MLAKAFQIWLQKKVICPTFLSKLLLMFGIGASKINHHNNHTFRIFCIGQTQVLKMRFISQIYFGVEIELACSKYVI